jgi:flagellar motor switch protein FliM
LSILQYILKIIVKELKVAWETVHVINFAVETKESNYTNVQIAAQNEIVILATYEFRIREEKGYVSICYPVIYLEPILNKLLIKNFLQDSVSKKTRSQEIKALLAGSRVDLEAILFEDRITFRDFLNLKEGVIISSNISTEETVLGTVNQKKKYDIIFGVRDNKKTIKVSKMHYDEQIDTIHVLKEIEENRDKKLKQLYKQIEETVEEYGEEDEL